MYEGARGRRGKTSATATRAARMPLSAWSDESFQEKDGAGFYVIAAAIFPASRVEQAREVMGGLRGPRQRGKFHWTEMDHAHRIGAAEAFASLGGLHLVAVGAPVPARAQERARSIVLADLVRHLHDFEVGRLFMEARERQLNARDVRTVLEARRFYLPKGSDFRIDHVYGTDDPLLWAADILAGSCRAEQLGQGEYRRLLGDDVLDFDVYTRC